MSETTREMLCCNCGERFQGSTQVSPLRCPRPSCGIEVQWIGPWGNTIRFERKEERLLRVCGPHDIRPGYTGEPFIADDEARELQAENATLLATLATVSAERDRLREALAGVRIIELTGVGYTLHGKRLYCQECRTAFDADAVAHKPDCLLTATPTAALGTETAK